MPNIQTHCAISKQRTGFPFGELHRWIDNPPDAKILGSDHRIERHAFTNNDMQYIKSYWDNKKGFGWGDKAVIEWLFHIAIDNISTAYKLSLPYYGEKSSRIIKKSLNYFNFKKFLLGVKWHYESEF